MLTKIWDFNHTYKIKLHVHVFGFLCIKEENFNLPSRSYCVYLTSSPCLKPLGYCAKCTAACTVSNDVKVENVTSVVVKLSTSISEIDRIFVQFNDIHY